ncbi:DUF2851 family protein [Halosquirtibacter laminarini]|uniref:DUF2851 family protein n=1 Tax=Halosquirtibacter laminarini TaxID=3374600 RepID=A0AC61NR30_9BACT|nr:DUF2851 family protein [Prolixibacteraceae bacterium]
MKISEHHIQLAWQYRLFHYKNLRTTCNKPIEILHPGYINKDSGPDFFQARIRIDSTLWVGNVEIHNRSSEWYEHNHHKDSSYENVILHVVLKEDRKVLHRWGEPIPCLAIVLLPKFTDKLDSWQACNNWLRCDISPDKISAVHFHFILQRHAISRIEEKSQAMIHMLEWSLNDWQHVFYYLLARSFGFRINSDAMEQLARSVPLKILYKERSSLQRLEALYFGQSGLLPTKGDSTWEKGLIEEYKFLQNKYELKPLNRGMWKFMRTRPYNFPTLRIAQFVSLLSSSTHLLSQTVEKTKVSELEAMYQVTPSEYWLRHFRFGKQGAVKSKKLSKNSMNSIVINTIIPFMMVYGDRLNRQEWKEKGIRWLESITYEKNFISKTWSDRGFKLKHAMDSQALISLHHHYCSKHRCLECDIGQILFKNLGR